MLISTENRPLPLVSVVVPTYNSARFIGEAVKSVIEQTYSHHEIIVVDDGSTDNTKDVLRPFDGRIRYLHQENRGPSAARNAGIKAAKGEYVCFLDADDLWLPQKLELQVAYMDCHQDVGVLFSDHEEFDQNGTVFNSFLKQKVFYRELVSSELIPTDRAFRMLVAENFISTPTVMVRRDSFKKTGLFDESIRSVEDRDMWLRFSARYKIACLPIVVCRRRLHGLNISQQSEQSITGRIKTLEKNWGVFPDLAPSALWHSQLGDAYCRLSYFHLAKNQRAEAMKAGFRSLGHGLGQIFTGGSLDSYPWALGIGSIPAALMGWRVSRYLWRTTNYLLGKSSDQSSSLLGKPL